MHEVCSLLLQSLWSRHGQQGPREMRREACSQPRALLVVVVCSRREGRGEEESVLAGQIGDGF